MKKIISILLVVSLIITVSACKPVAEGESSSISSRSSESNETQSMNSEITSVTESIPEKEVVPIMETEEEDILQFENSEESNDAWNNIFNGGAGNINSWDAMVDNTTDIAELAATQPIDAQTTWILSYRQLDPAWYNFFHLHEFNTGNPVQFIRELDKKYYSDWLASEVQSGYTVFESEMGGYLYMFLGHRTDTDEIQLKSTIYVSHRMSIEEFASLNVGDSIDRVAEIDPVAYFVKRNSEISTVSHNTYHLCTDGLLEIEYNKGDDITIKEIKLYEDFIRPNIELMADPEEQQSMARRYDFTILPQDYPPA